VSSYNLNWGTEENYWNLSIIQKWLQRVSSPSVLRFAQPAFSHGMSSVVNLSLSYELLRTPQWTHYLLTGSDSLPAATAQYQHVAITLRSLQLLKMGTWLPETCWATCKREIKDNTKVTSSWFLIHTEWRCTVNHTLAVNRLSPVYQVDRHAPM